MTGIASFRGVAALLSTCLILAGCGGTDGEPVYPVTGKVTLSGGPLVGATVTFAPREGQPVALGRTNTAGEYELTTYESGDGAAEGEFAVIVIKSAPGAAAAEGGEDEGHSADVNANFEEGHDAGAAAAEDTGSIVPDRYAKSETTPLSYTVKSSGDNVNDIEIE